LQSKSKNASRESASACGASIPAAANDASVPSPDFSIKQTSTPRRASDRAMDKPITPPPTMMISCLLIEFVDIVAFRLWPSSFVLWPLIFGLWLALVIINPDPKIKDQRSKT
jgi:hypothetical protein